MNDMHQTHFPLTTAQSEIWLAETLTPGTAQYNIAEYLEIHGPIDPVLFEVALRQVVGDAESLHLRFINDDGDGPRQILDRTADWPFPVIDISGEPDPQAAAESWMQADLAKPRDLIGGPLFAYVLFRAGSNRFFWYQRNHHPIIDGFGGGLIARRLADVYAATVEGREPGPSPFGSFQNLLAADAEYRISEVFLRDRQYWQERFADRPDPVSLAGRRMPAGGILRRQTRLSPETSTALRVLARDAGTTLPQLLTALAMTYLHRMTGTTDLVVGSPTRPEVDQPQPNDHDILAVLMEDFDGPLIDLSEGPLSFARVKEHFLTRPGTPLASFDDDVLERMFANLRVSPGLLKTFVPAIVSSDVLLFRATLVENEENLSSPDTWQPCVKGRIIAHDVACQHGRMMRPDASPGSARSSPPRSIRRDTLRLHQERNLCHDQSIRNRRRQLFGACQRRGTTFPMAGLHRRSRRLGHNLRTGLPCHLPVPYRNALDRHAAR